MRAVNPEVPKQPPPKVAKVLEGKRRKLCNRQYLLESGLTEEVLSDLLKSRLTSIHPGTKEHWYDVDAVIDAMEAATPGFKPTKGKAK